MLSTMAFLLLPLVGLGVRLRRGVVPSLVAVGLAAAIIDSDFRWHWLTPGGDAGLYPLGVWPVAAVAALSSLWLSRRRIVRLAHFTGTVVLCFFASGLSGIWLSQAPRRPALVAPDSVPDRVRAVTGCWRFVPRVDSTGYAGRRYLGDAVMVRLDTVAARRAPRARRGLSLRVVFDTTDESRPRVRFAHWALARRPGRLIAFWGDGYTGIDLRLRRRGDTLSGRAYHTSDFALPMRRWTPVTATRTPCPAALRVPADTLGAR